MQTTPVRATCPRCGTIETDTSHIGLVIDREANEATFLATCPKCGVAWTDVVCSPILANDLIQAGALHTYLG